MAKKDIICGASPFVFQGKNKKTLPYRQGLFNAKQEGKPALLLFLHGAGERGTDNKLQMKYLPEHASRYLEDRGIKCLMLCPQCPEEKQWVDTPWNALSHSMSKKPSESMALVMQLLDEKIREFQVDTTRIYISGISMGGYGTWDLISRRPDFFAAAIPVCGGGDTAQAPKLKDMPIRIWHGGSDSVVPVFRSRSMAEALWNAGNTKFDYREMRGVDHDSWNSCYQDTRNFDWLFSWRKHK